LLCRTAAINSRVPDSGTRVYRLETASQPQSHGERERERERERVEKNTITEKANARGSFYSRLIELKSTLQ